MKPEKAMTPETESKPPAKAAGSKSKKAEDNKAATAKSQTSPWQYQTDDSAAPDAKAPRAPYIQPVSWTASEYVAHQKNVGWFVLVMLAILGVATVVYFLTNDLISPTVIVVIGLAFTVFAGRAPQTLEYSLDGTGIHVGQKTYLYERFRSFSILADEVVPTIMLIPMRRFDLPLTIHFDAADADKIVQLLGNYLPGEERNAPPVDRLMSKIRF